MLGQQPAGRPGVHEALEVVQQGHAVQVRQVRAQFEQVLRIALHKEILPPSGTPRTWYLTRSTLSARTFMPAAHA